MSTQLEKQASAQGGNDLPEQLKPESAARVSVSAAKARARNASVHVTCILSVNLSAEKPQPSHVPSPCPDELLPPSNIHAMA